MKTVLSNSNGIKVVVGTSGKSVKLNKEERAIILEHLKDRRRECDGFGYDEEEEELKEVLTKMINKIEG